jgi:hypothetical protein
MLYEFVLYGRLPVTRLKTLDSKIALEHSQDATARMLVA